MPLLDTAERQIREMLSKLGQGERVKMCPIGYFTEVQFVEINRLRHDIDLHPLESNEVLFLGRHLHGSRTKDGYTVDDMIAQIVSAMSVNAVPIITPKMTCLENPDKRLDGYGNMVNDRSVFEMTARKPKAELFSVIPKGDENKPVYAKSSP